MNRLNWNELSIQLQFYSLIVATRTTHVPLTCTIVSTRTTAVSLPAVLRLPEFHCPVLVRLRYLYLILGCHATLHYRFTLLIALTLIRFVTTSQLLSILWPVLSCHVLALCALLCQRLCTQQYQCHLAKLQQQQSVPAVVQLSLPLVRLLAR